MRKIIHHLRKQPEHVRVHVLHISIAVLAAIMIMLWIFSLGRTLTNPETKEKIKQDLQPFSVLKDNIVGGYNAMGNDDSSVVTGE